MPWWDNASALFIKFCFSTSVTICRAAAKYVNSRVFIIVWVSNDTITLRVKCWYSASTETNCAAHAAVYAVQQFWNGAMILKAKLARWITCTHHSWFCVPLLQTEGKPHPKQDYLLMSELKFVGVKTKTAHQHFMSLFYPRPKLTSLSPPPLSRFYDALQWRLERLRWMMPVNDTSLLASVFGCLFKTKTTPALIDSPLIYSYSRGLSAKGYVHNQQTDQ